MPLYYIVGTPESFERGGFLCGPRRRSLTKREIQYNIMNLNEVMLFSSQDDALAYARSLRITEPSNVFNSTGKKIAPIISMELMKVKRKYEFSEESIKSLVVEFQEYASPYANVPNNNPDGTPLIRSTQIEYICLNKLAFKLPDFKIKAAEFPDSNYPVMLYDDPSYNCTIS